MIQTLQSKDIDLRYLIDNFGIQLARSPDLVGWVERSGTQQMP